MDDVLVERVLRAVELVPAGRVVTYGDLAELVGIGPRLVGRIMGTWGSGVPWWRVVNANGDLPDFHLARAHEEWRLEGIAVKPTGRGCRIRAHRADLALLADAWEHAVADLPTAEPGPPPPVHD
jgi:alkylated DNA nucleotide flippase Atl1